MLNLLIKRLSMKLRNNYKQTVESQKSKAKLLQVTNRYWLLSLLICLLAFPPSAFTQETLSLEQSVELAMKHNHNIKIFRNNQVIAENSAKPGNAGMLPNVTLNAGTNYSNNNTRLVFAGNIPEVEQNGAESQSNNASINLNYTLFDGLAMFHNYDILKLSKNQAELNTRLNIENTLMSVIQSYYEMARLQNQMKVAKEALAISKERWLRAKTYNEFGGSSKVEFLSAEVDLNTDSVNFMNAELAWVNARRDLNFLMGVENDRTYNVSENVSLNNLLAIEDLFEKAKQNNAAVLNTAYNKQIAEKQLKATNSTKLPTIAANASYGFNTSVNEAGIVLENYNNGVNAGLSLTYPLFTGNRNTIQRQNAKVQVENATLQEELAEAQLLRDLNNTYASYQNLKSVIGMEQKNLKTAELNFNRTKELFELGKVTNTQFREAQLNLLRSKLNINNFKFQQKVTEAQLLRISGELLGD